MRLGIAKPVESPNMKPALIMICLVVSMIAGGCAEIQGKLIKTYHSEYRAAVQASSEALENLEIPVLEEVSDELTTKFLARRPNGIPVTVEVTRVDQYFTRVAVRTGDGIDRYTDKDISMQIQGFIRKRLGHATKED
jgi:Protein of unknown function (DUF3568)